MKFIIYTGFIAGLGIIFVKDDLLWLGLTMVIVSFIAAIGEGIE